MSVADPCNDNGFMELIFNAPSVYRQRGSAGGHFMWISKEIVESTLKRLGFELSFPVSNGRDIFFTAKLIEPDKAKSWLNEVGATWLDY